jgi:hypothetical protein
MIRIGAIVLLDQLAHDAAAFGAERPASDALGRG